MPVLPRPPTRHPDRPPAPAAPEPDPRLRQLTAARAGAEALDGLAFGPTATLRLLCDANLRRIVLDGNSAVIDYGQATRTIPPALWNALAVRDRRCRYPGCDRPAHWCEGHHVQPWLHGGPTTLTTLVMLCTRHRHLHKPGWQAKILPDGTLQITDPRGRTRTSRPPGRTPPLPLTA